jgi:DNA polymerase II large subunit
MKYYGEIDGFYVADVEIDMVEPDDSYTLMVDEAQYPVDLINNL